MPFRLGENRSKIQFVTSAEMPNLIFRAAAKTGRVSNTHYIQQVLAKALAKDLDLPLEDILANLPPVVGEVAAFNGKRHSQAAKTAQSAG